jgi:hypothetical protein
VTIDRRTVVLGVAAVVAVAAAVTVTAVNHRSQASPERRAVTTYIHHVNGIQNQMHTPLTRVLFAFRDFTAKGGPKKTSAAELHRAARTLDRLNRRLAALPAPPEAAKLRRLILQLVRQQTAITHEVEQMAVFSPKFAVILTRARAANTALGKALGAIQTPQAHKLRGTRKQVLAAQRAYQAEAAAAAGEQADAVEAYDREITDVLQRLRALRPPQVFTAGYRAQVTSLADVLAAGGRLADGLRKGDRSQVPTLGRRFTLASREAQTLAAQRAQIAAIRAYNARAKNVSRAAGRVETELLRLQKALP